MEQEYRQKLLTYRRQFHQNPEPGWLEYATSAQIAAMLEELGLNVFVGEEIIHAADRMSPPTKEETERYKARALQQNVQYAPLILRMGNATGVVGIYDSGRPGKTIAFRSDIDALMISETKEEHHFPLQKGFLSNNPSVFHACGHDGHAAIVLTLAHWLMKEKDLIDGKVIFIFQPAEEGVRGANALTKNWKFGKIDTLFCFHIGFTGEDEFVAGAENFLATTKLDVTFEGKTSHAGLAPNRGRNALLAAADSALLLHGIPRNEEGVTRINVGTLCAGTSRNAICQHAEMKLETRGENSDLNSYMLEEALRIMKGTAISYGVTELHHMVGSSESARSSEELSRKIHTMVHEMNCYNTCTLHQSFGASDDGAVVMNMVQKQGGQAVYMLFGTTIKGKHHEVNFDFDEGVLEKACDILHAAYDLISKEE